MNKINYILITLLLGGSVSLNAQTSKAASEMQLADTLSIGYQMNVSSRTSSYSINGVNASAFEKSPYIDISKALYGKVAGLNVYQGTGSSAEPDQASHSAPLPGQRLPWIKPAASL